MHREKLVAFIVAFAATVASAKFCGKLTAFDALCIKDDAVFIVSTAPCSVTKSESEHISLTVIYNNGTLQEYYNIGSSKQIKTPVSYGRKDVGVMFGVRYYEEGKKKGYAHVNVSLGNFADNGVNSKQSVLDVWFYLERAGDCKHHSLDGDTFVKSPLCKSSKRTGSFSSYCISKDTTSIDKKSEGIFMVSMDPCTVPYSYVVTAVFLNKSIEVMKRFTASKTDQFVPVESATCGLKTKVAADHGKYPISLLYGCDDATAGQVLTDFYFPNNGVLCPASNCTKLSPLHHKCNINMITGDNKMSRLSADVKLKGCGMDMQGDFAITMEGQAYPLNLHLSRETRNADFMFHDKAQNITEHKMPESVNGFLPSTGGHISLSVVLLQFERIIQHLEEKRIPNLAWAVVERHYGESYAPVNFISPLFNIEFVLPPKCKEGTRGRLSKGAKVAIPIIVILVVAVVVILAVLYYRKRRGRGAEAGNGGNDLPSYVEFGKKVDA